MDQRIAELFKKWKRKKAKLLLYYILNVIVDIIANILYLLYLPFANNVGIPRIIDRMYDMFNDKIDELMSELVYLESAMDKKTVLIIDYEAWEDEDNY